MGSRSAFTIYRNRLKNNPNLPENRVKIEKLQRLNNVVTLQEQKKRAVALKNELYDYKTKVDESLAEFQNQLYDLNIEFTTNNDELKAKLDLILDNLNDIGVIIQEIESDKNILKKILEEINLKVDNLIDLSKVLQKNIKDEFSYLLEQVKNLFNNSDKLIKNLFNELTNLIKNNFKILNDLITEKFLNLNLNIDTIISITTNTYELLNKVFKELKLFDLNKLKDLLINIQNNIVENTTNCKNQVIKNSNEAHILTRTEFTGEIVSASTTITGAIELETSTLIKTLGAEIAGVGLLIENTYNLLINTLNDGFETIRSQINNLQTLTLNNFNVIERELTLFIKNFKSYVTEVLNDWYKKNNKNIIEKITNFICERIVGESYIKYDANYMYMPTIILRYKTKNIEDERKYSQIKLRLNYKTEEITNSLINDLKLKIQNISNKTYIYGNLRCNYVSEKRLFKTTIFCNSKNSALNLFNNLIPLTKTNYLKENFSFTENSKRNHGLRRSSELYNIKVNKPNNFSEVEMALSSAYLQVNGLEHQIKLF